MTLRDFAATQLARSGVPRGAVSIEASGRNEHAVLVFAFGPPLPVKAGSLMRAYRSTVVALAVSLPRYPWGTADAHDDFTRELLWAAVAVHAAVHS